MGGRGSSSGSTGPKTITFEKMMKKREKVEYLFNMQKSVTISRNGYIPYTQIYKKANETLSSLPEAMVEVPKGDYNRRVKQITGMGFKIKEQTSFKDSDPVYTPVYLYIKK